MPGGIAHAGNGDQDGKGPEAFSERGGKVAHADPEEGRRQQDAAVGDVIGQHAGRQIGNRCAQVVDHEQKTDLGRRQPHGDAKGGDQDVHRDRHQIIGAVANGKGDEEIAVEHE